MWKTWMLMVGSAFALSACGTLQTAGSAVGYVAPQDRQPEHGFRGRPNPMVFGQPTDEYKFLVVNGYTGQPVHTTCQGIASVVHVAHYSNQTDFKVTPRRVGTCIAKFIKRGDPQKSFSEQIIVK